ncbi:MAG: hypothetical protein J7578_04760 [Chitinophagaceae bacterium]|nr:hypothetical protein [Chitinophagaceae bacterium]
MRKALYDIELAERFLFHQMDTDEKKHFAVQLLTDAALHEQVTLQECTYRLIRFQARMERKEQLERIHHQLMQEPAFNNILQQIFP